MAFCLKIVHNVNRLFGFTLRGPESRYPWTSPSLFIWASQSSVWHWEREDLPIFCQVRVDMTVTSVYSCIYVKFHWPTVDLQYHFPLFCRLFLATQCSHECIVFLAQFPRLEPTDISWGSAYYLKMTLFLAFPANRGLCRTSYIVGDHEEGFCHT